MFSPLILAKKKIYIAVWNVGKTRLLRVDQRIVCPEKGKVGMILLLPFRAKYVHQTHFQQALATFTMCLIDQRFFFSFPLFFLISCPLFSPPELGLTYISQIFLGQTS